MTRRDEGGLRLGWFSLVVAPNASLDEPGIYEWRIDGGGVYVGASRYLKKQIGAYPRNVANLISGGNWHGQPGRSFRPVHKGLSDAYRERRSVSVVVLENCAASALLERKRFWLALRRNEEAAGGPAVLNGT